MGHFRKILGAVLAVVCCSGAVAQTSGGTSHVSYEYYGARSGTMSFSLVRTSPTQVRLTMAAAGMHDNAYISSSSGGAGTGAWYVGANPTSLNVTLNVGEGATVTVNISGGHPQGAVMNWSPSSWVLTPDVLNPQIVTVTPAAVTIVQGESVGFTAAGGENGYVWDWEGDGETGGFSSTGATGVFTAGNANGVFQVFVYSPAGNGFEQSNTATAVIAVVAPVNRVTLKIPGNNTGYPMEFMIVQDGVTIHSFEIAPGAAAQVGTFNVPSNAPVTVLARLKDVMFTDQEVWTEVPDAVGPSTSTTIDPTTTPENDPPPPANDVTPPSAPKPAPGAAQKSVWKTITSGNGGDGLTASQAAEGFDKVVEAVDRVGASLRTGDVLEEPEEIDTPAIQDQADRLLDSTRGVLPEMPTISPIGGTVSSITMPFKVGQHVDVSGTVNFAEWSGPISVFRGLCSGVMLIFFAIVYTKTIRGAFAQ